MWSLGFIALLFTPADLPKEVAEPLRKYMHNVKELLPTEEVPGGLRVTFREPFYPTGWGQQGASPVSAAAKPVMPKPEGYDHYQLILRRITREPLPPASALPWRKLDQRYHHEQIYLGRSANYDWYGDIPLFTASHFVRSAELEGGPDPIDLAIRSLAIEDPGGMTANSGTFYLREVADKALDQLRRVIFDNDFKAPGRAIQALAGSQSKEVTTLLLELYNSGHEKLAGSAGWTLVHKPFRPEAREAYLDMVQRGRNFPYSGEAAAELGIKEAAPYLINSMRRSPAFWFYSDLYLYGQHLLGKPIPEDIMNFRVGRWTAEKTARIKTALLKWDNKEAAAVVAFAMYCHRTKGPTEVQNQAGHAVMLTLPRNVTRPLLETVMRDLDSQTDKEHAKRLLAELG